MPANTSSANAATQSVGHAFNTRRTSSGVRIATARARLRGLATRSKGDLSKYPRLTACDHAGRSVASALERVTGCGNSEISHPSSSVAPTSKSGRFPNTATKRREMCRKFSALRALQSSAFAAATSAHKSATVILAPARASTRTPPPHELQKGLIKPRITQHPQSRPRVLLLRSRKPAALTRPRQL